MDLHFLVFISGALILCVQPFNAALIPEAIQSKLCEHPVCADPPHGCVAYVVKDGKDCPVHCTYSCGAPWCAVRTCLEPCPGGYYKDKMGCHSCHCKPYCEDKRCLSDCPSGYQKDTFGCRTCICLPSSTPSSAATTTATVRASTQVEAMTSQTNSNNNPFVDQPQQPEQPQKPEQPQQPTTAQPAVCVLDRNSGSPSGM